MYILLHGDSERNAALRHELPIAIGDPFLVVVGDAATTIVTNGLEVDRVRAARPDAAILLGEELGVFDLIREGWSRRDALLEADARAVRQLGIREALVPDAFPVALADRLRADGVELIVDGPRVDERRRVKTVAQMDGIRRAQRAAEDGLGAGASLLRAAEGIDGTLHVDGRPLLAEDVRAAIRDVCAVAGCPAPPDIMVSTLWTGGGHDPGTGALPVDRPITIDLWPRDEASGCWADMTRTFVVGEISEEVAQLRSVVLASLQAARDAVRPGVTGRELYDRAAEVIEAAGHPTQRTRKPGETLRHGFYFSLGHGVGLEVHEAPGLGLAGGDPLVAGDVLALEPGIEGLEGIGGVRYEDLVVVTADGCETLTQYSYELAP